MQANAWNVTPKEAIEIQKKLRSEIKIQKLDREVKLIGGADISLNMFEKTAYAGIIVLTYPELEPVSKSLIVSEVNFPYIPGLLSFREIPSLLLAWEKLEIKPDVLMVDGQGIAHPRGMGIASHFGLIIDTPTIGVAKSQLTPGIAHVLETKKNANPLYISPGHLIDFEDSLKIVKTCLKGYRLPEPTRLTHNLVNQLRRGEVAI